MHESRLQDIIKTSETNSILIFQKENLFIIHGTIKNYFDSRTDNNKLTQAQYESLVRYTLKTAKLCIKEYTNTTDDYYILDKEGSPYNWTSYLDIMDEEFIKPISSVIQSKNWIFVSFYDFNDQNIHYLSFEDDDILSSLFSFFTEINCFDVVIDDLKLEKMLMNMGLNVNYCKEKVLPYYNVDGNEYKRIIGLLVKHLSIVEPKIKEFNRTCFMQIDHKTLRNLDFQEIIKLVKPETMQGRRLLGQICRQPLTNPNEILKRQEYVESLYRFNKSCLRGLPDLIKYSRRILRLKIPDIIVIHKSITKLDPIVNNLTEVENSTGSLNDFINPLRNLSHSFLQLRDEIEKIIDLSECCLNQEISPTIYDLEQERIQINIQLTDEFNRVLEINKKIKLEKKANSPVTFKIPRTEFSIFKENNFVEKTILKSGIIFTTKTLEQYNEELDRINKEYVIEEKKILDNLLIFMNNYGNSFEIMNYIVSMIDLFHALSTLRDIGFTKPDIGSDFILEGAFHPLVQNCIKNSIKLSGDNRFCVLTGPNMGGKSTFIKLCSIVSILTQIGSLVPCLHAVVPIMSGIYVRIGANDMACMGMSTFMVEMNDIARICKNATPNTLIIIDELGRGTSALDGLSLALSIKEFLLKKNCYTLFATHFPEICGEDVLNLKMTCSVSDMLTMLYKIEEGVCDVSLGIEVAESIGFPEEVLKMTKQYLKEQE